MTGHHPEHEPQYEVAWRSVIKQDIMNLSMRLPGIVVVIKTYVRLPGVADNVRTSYVDVSC